MLSELETQMADERLRAVILCNFPREQNHIESFNEKVRTLWSLKLNMPNSPASRYGKKARCAKKN